MPRKLKTYITNLGFFELALAAPSMKAALEAWGMGHNAFHQGFARETDDPRIVAATMAQPGVVLKRPVGSKSAFQENAELPKGWAPPNIEPPKPSTKKSGRAKTKASPRPSSSEGHKKTKSKTDDRDRAAIISFEKEKARREREREKQAARENAQKEKDRTNRERETEKARAALQRGQARHEDAMAALEKERDKLERRIRIERERWDEEREELKAALRGAGA